MPDENVTLNEALRLHPELHRMFDLGRIGWTGRKLVIDGQHAIVLSYNWPQHIDAIWIFDRANCIGLRSLDDAPGMVGGTVAKYEGDLESVLDDMLNLPAPGEPKAPQLVRRSSLLWTP